MPERLDRIHFTIGRPPHKVEVSWDGRDELLGRLRQAAGCESIVQKIEGVGATRPVQLGDAEKERLSSVLELWVLEVPDFELLPAGIWDLRNALLDDVQDALNGQ